MILRITLVMLLLVIAYLSLTPTETMTIGNDKISHFIAYSVLMLNAGLISFEHRSIFLRTILLVSLYGAAMEIGQYFVPGRVMSGYDMLANISGVMTGTVISVLFHDRLTRILGSLGMNPPTKS